MSKPENYKLRAKDFVPFVGYNRYHERNKDSLVDTVAGHEVQWNMLTDQEKKVKTRELFLFGYNAFTFIGPLIFATAAAYTFYIEPLMK